MPRERDSLPQLGDLELALLDLIWDRGVTDVASAHAAIGKRRSITPNTVGSALERLYRKGLVLREKVSHAYRYQAGLSRESFAAQRMRESVGGARTLSDAGLLAAFVNLVADEDDESLDRLEALIAQKRSERGEA